MSPGEFTSCIEAFCTRCATTPGTSPFQPIAVSAVEICRAAANLAGNENHATWMEKLAAFAVDETERACNGMEMEPLLLLEDTVQILERVEVKLDEIRRTIEQMPTTMQSKKGKLAKYLTLDRDTHLPKRELKALVDALLKGAHKFPAAESKGISLIDLANLTASAVCEAPVLNSLEPAVAIPEIIVETAQISSPLAYRS